MHLELHCLLILVSHHFQDYLLSQDSKIHLLHKSWDHTRKQHKSGTAQSSQHTKQYQRMLTITYLESLTPQKLFLWLLLPMMFEMST